MWSCARTAGLLPVHAAPWRLPGSRSAVCPGPACLQAPGDTAPYSSWSEREKYALGPACDLPLPTPWNEIVEKIQVCVVLLLGTLHHPWEISEEPLEYTDAPVSLGPHSQHRQKGIHGVGPLSSQQRRDRQTEEG